MTQTGTAIIGNDSLTRWLRLLLTSFLFLVGCAKKPTKIQGSVFIVTQGGENYKLGLVSVKLASGDAVEQARIELKKAASAGIPAIRKKYQAAADELIILRPRVEQAREDYQKAKGDISDLVREIERNGGMVLSDLYWVTGRENDFDFPECVQRLNKATQVLAPKGENLRQLSSKFSELWDITQGARSEFRDLVNPSPEDIVKATAAASTDKTDADGAFSFSVNKPGKYTLMAVASRMVGSKTEKYAWAVPLQIDDLGNSMKVILSNDNLLTEVFPGTLSASEESEPVYIADLDFDFKVELESVVTSSTKWTLK